MNKKLLKIFLLTLGITSVIGLFTTMVIGSMRSHTCQASSVISYDNNSHYYKCRNFYCNKHFAEKEHEFNWVIDKEETCELNGVKHEECECGYNRNVGTVIDEFKYNANIALKDNLTRNTYSNVWDDGNHSPAVLLNLGYFENERNNTSFKAHYQMASYLSGEYVNGNLKNDSVTNITQGFTIYNENGNSFEIRLRIAPSSHVDYALEIATENNGIYRLQNNEITTLCKDYVNNYVLDVDFGVYETENLGLVYGFRFKTKNYEITYLSNNSGSLKSDTTFVKWLDSTTMSEHTFTLNDVLGFIGENGIHNKGTNAITVKSSAYTGRETYGCLVSCESVSTWLMNRVKYIEWQNS